MVCITCFEFSTFMDLHSMSFINFPKLCFLFYIMCCSVRLLTFYYALCAEQIPQREIKVSFIHSCMLQLYSDTSNSCNWKIMNLSCLMISVCGCWLTFGLALLFEQSWSSLPGNVPNFEHTHLRLKSAETYTEDRDILCYKHWLNWLYFHTQYLLIVLKNDGMEVEWSV